MNVMMMMGKDDNDVKMEDEIEGTLAACSASSSSVQLTERKYSI